MSAGITRLLSDPKFRITLVHHPDSNTAADIAAALENHYFGGPFRDISPGLGIDVNFRADGRAAGNQRPPDIEFINNCCDAVVVLADDTLVTDVQNGGAWKSYIADLAVGAGAKNNGGSLFVVALDRGALPMHPAVQAEQHIRFCDWDEKTDRVRRLERELTHVFCRLLERWVGAIESGAPLPPVVKATRAPVNIFISHSKADGEKLAKKVRDHIHHESQLHSFFDTYDILPGATFSSFIEENISNSIVLVVQTDTFASREWCRREVLTARRLSIPVVVLHAVKEGEARAFPYLGNVPVVSHAAGKSTRIAEAVGALLDKYLETLYWRLHRKELQTLSGDPDAMVIAHAPDLLTLVQCRTMPKTIIYPDPPLGQAESELLACLSSDVKLRTPMSLAVEGIDD